MCRHSDSSWSTALAIIAIGVGAVPAEAEETPRAKREEPVRAKRDEGFWTRGRIDLRAVYRSAQTSSTDERESDQDLFQDIFVEGGRGSSVRAEASGRIHEDIDGKPEVSVFRDVYDTTGDAAQGLLYTGYVEVLEQGALARLRAGRQYYGEGVELRFDGALAETKALGQAVKLAAYGGSPVHLWEASRTGDWLAGGAAELVSIPKTTVRLDYAHVTDERPDLARAEERDGFPRVTRREDDYFQLVATHRLTKAVRLRGQASTFDFSKSSRFEAETIFRYEALDLSGRARYTYQLGAYRDLSIQFTPLDVALGEYAPYHEGHAELRKGFLASKLGVGGGVNVRELAKEEDEGPFNHAFQRYFALGDLSDLPWEGFSASLLAEWYRSETADRTYQVSADVGQKVGKFTVGAGTSFALYRFDEFYLEERERVRSYFATLEWKPLDNVRPRLRYSFEDDDEGEYHAVRFDLRISF